MNEQQIQRQQKEQAIIEEQQRLDYKAAFLESEAGMRVLRDILREAQVFQKSRNAEMSGAQGVGLYIMERLEINNLDGAIWLTRQGERS